MKNKNKRSGDFLLKMKIPWILLLLIHSSTASYKEESQEEEFHEFLPEKRKPETDFSPFIMMKKRKGYSFPILAKNKNHKISFYAKMNADFRYLCPIENVDRLEKIKETTKLSQDMTEELDIHHCLFDTKSKDQKQSCPKEIEPQMHKIKENKTPKRCGQLSVGQLYTFEYLVCKIVSDESIIQKLFSTKKDTVLSTQRVVVYEFCYDHSSKQVLYTNYKIRSPLLLENPKLLENFAIYESDTMNTDGLDIFQKDFESAANEYEQKKQLAKKENKELVLHKLVPPENMAFGLWKKPTYHYANVKLMPEKVSQVWIFIDRRIRQQVIKRNARFQIYMGEFTTDGKPSLRYWCKIVRAEDYQQSVVIIAFENQEEASSLEILKNCDVEMCNFKNWPENDGVDTLLARCCMVEKKHRHLFGLKPLKRLYSRDESQREHYFDLDKIPRYSFS